ncbi:MAG TPA: Maf family protein [Gaiellales bacterium]|nr:Maf family protein [Gaiellales bacterium]
MIPESLGGSRRLVLASRSPQRRAILTMLGVEFEAVAPDYDEPDLPGTPAEIAVAHARAKAAAVEGERVLGVDTIVVVDGRVLGKPPDEPQAREFLGLLSGRTHAVHSGLCLRVGGTEHVRHAVTEITFAPLDDADVDWYVASGEWRGRAGGYAVQGLGAALVRSISGDYQNVVGLPVPALIDAMHSVGIR